MADTYVDEIGSLDPASKTVKQTRQGFEAVYNPMNYPYPGEKRGFNIGQAFGVVLAVASLAVPGIGSTIGSAILSAVGITGVAPAVAAGVGAAALSAASTAAAGGSVEDVLKAAAGAGVASGLNLGMGGGVSGAVTGSVAGSAIKGGTLDQALTNAFAAGVGAGIQDVAPNPDAGKIISTAARTYIASGGNVDQTLLNTAATAIGTLDQPTTYAKTTTAQPAQGAEPFKYGNDTYQELDDGTAKVTTQSGNVRIINADTFNEIKQDYAADVAAGAAPSGPVIPPQTVAETPPVAQEETGLDLVKKVRSLSTGATPTPEEQFPTKTIEKEKESPVVTDVPTIRPDTTAGLPGAGTDLGRVDIGYVTDPFVDIAPPSNTGTQDLGTKYINYPVDPFVDIAPPSEPTGGTTLDTVRVNYPVDPFVDIAPPTELEKVTVTGTRDLVDPFVDIAPPPELDKVTVTEKSEEPVVEAPTPSEVKAEEPDKPKEEPKKLYPTVTSVPPPKRPRAPPIITGASPARLLADALAAYRPAGAIEGVGSGGKRQNVWNEKSLRLKDALGL